MTVNHTITNLDRAVAAWGDTMPDWIRMLANAADRTNQRAVEIKLNRKGGYVSKILNRRYAGSYEEAETLVRVTFGSDQVECPIMGSIPLGSCVRNRRRRSPPVNQMHHLWARSCPTCALNTDREEA